MLISAVKQSDSVLTYTFFFILFSILPKTVYEINIILILKPKTPPKKKNYRQISVTNINVSIDLKLC